jgi:argininosuccinate synthase
MNSSDGFISKYSELVYNGFWFSPEREAFQALVTETQRDVTGVVGLKFYKGNIIAAGRKSPQELVRSEDRNNGKRCIRDATGFIRLNALRLKLRAARKGDF